MARTTAQVTSGCPWRARAVYLSAVHPAMVDGPGSATSAALRKHRFESHRIPYAQGGEQGSARAKEISDTCMCAHGNAATPAAPRRPPPHPTTHARPIQPPQQTTLTAMHAGPQIARARARQLRASPPRQRCGRTSRDRRCAAPARPRSRGRWPPLGRPSRPPIQSPRRPVLGPAGAGAKGSRVREALTPANEEHGQHR